jgi:hypothetical protein
LLSAATALPLPPPPRRRQAVAAKLLPPSCPHRCANAKLPPLLRCTLISYVWNK